MNRALALAWLILTLLPFAIFIYVVAFSGAPTSPQEARAYATLMFTLGGTAVIGGWLLVASYMVYAFKSRHVPSDKKALWAAVLFFGNMLVMPIFWFLYVWRPLRSPQNAA
jgi:hypothetical protein